MLAKPFVFKKAQPVWQEGQERAMHQTLVFKTALSDCNNAIIHLACSVSYVLYVNGIFVATGPARTAHGHHRVDEINLSEHLTEQTNVVSVHVTGAYVPTYAIARHEAFLCAEILSNNEIIAYTATDGNWLCCAYPYRINNVNKYAEQRLFAEVYLMSPDTVAMDTDIHAGDLVDLTTVDTGNFVCREVYYTDYEPLRPKAKIAYGNFTYKSADDIKMPIYHEQSVYESDISKAKVPIVGYPLADQEFDYALNAKKILCHPSKEFSRNISSTSLTGETYMDLDMGCNYTGLIHFHINCEKDTTLYVMFDELLDDNGDINITRLSSINLVVWHLSPGTYTLTTSEAYTLKYLRFACVDGACSIIDPQLLRISFPPINKELVSNDNKLQAVYAAAVETFRQNVYDIYMDCPSRERAGWLCDSFFTARAEYALTGNCTVERAFLANFLLPENVPNVPEGMLPMCYPSEIPRVRFIPNWAMFFVLELEEYYARTGDNEFILAAKPKMLKLLEYFRSFENEYGLLEKLDNWVFVEWSMANKLTQDVNFPTNMLYSRVKRALAKLYDMQELIAEADQMVQNILSLSLDGLFFCDNAIRQDGKLVLSGEHTEVCQYYAFFCDIVTPQSHPALWQTLINDFGPDRTDTHPEIHPANTFIGHYLRLDIFHRYGLKEEILQNIVGYFYYMAQQVGTLWENKTPHASCCHGFTSCIIHWLDKFGMLK